MPGQRSRLQDPALWSGPVFPRRRFLASVVALPASLAAGTGETPTIRAAVVGHSGQGDFGHGLETIFRGRPGIAEVVLADPVESGRRRFGASAGAVRTYADWKEMLERERPALVSVASRHATRHAEIALACLRSGAHVYVEKPFVRDPAEADAVLAAAEPQGLRVAVAHTMRMSPAVRGLREVFRSGRLGELREMRAWGKQDHRAGGEDLMVLGTHLLDLFRRFAGDPLSVSAKVLQQGRPVVPSDRRRVADDVGWVAGDQVSAEFEFAGGVVGTFRSDRALRETTARWGIEFLGSGGAARLNCDLVPSAFLRESSPWSGSGRTERWVPLDGVPAMAEADHNRLPVDDWLEAIRVGREPECGGRGGAWAVEMAAGVHHSALTGRRVPFPLAVRTHPLEA